MDIKEVKQKTKKFFNWLWNSDSILSYIVFLVIAFVLIKYLFLPGLGLLLGTPLPLAIVESCSMYHEEDLFSNYEQWWTNQESKYTSYSINKENFDEFGFKKGFNKGDILVITGKATEKIKIGDVIIFDAGQQRPLIHRVIRIENKDNETIFSTLGDNNQGQLEIEKSIKSEQIIGKASFKLMPFIGWIKLIFFENSRPESQKGLCNSQ